MGYSFNFTLLHLHYVHRHLYTLFAIDALGKGAAHVPILQWMPQRGRAARVLMLLFCY